MDESIQLADPLTDQASVEFLQRWQTLVSTTNWEKGRIIQEWRSALEAAGAAPPQFSDEAWSRRIGNVTGQHVGRLRRVWERYADVRETFPGLSWSHFCAALDWDDAELWLEGAIQNDWSVAAMRRQRWEAFGGLDTPPRDEEVVSAELDEDFDRRSLAPTGDTAERNDSSPGRDFVAETFDDTTPIVDPGQSDLAYDEAHDGSAPFDDHPPPVAIGELPEDVAQVFETFKLVILRHKHAGWSEISQSDLLGCLATLKHLAVSTSDGMLPERG